MRADVHQALAAHADDIGATWAPFPVALVGQQYRVMAEWAQDLDAVNPFDVLADGLPPGDPMGTQTLVVVGITGADGRPGFALLAGRAEPPTPTAAVARICRTTQPVRRLPR